VASSRTISGVGAGAGAGLRPGFRLSAPAGPRPAPEAPRLHTHAGRSGRPAPAAEMHIGALRLSLPGVGAPAGRRIAERVSALLAERWPAGLQGRQGRQGRIERLELKVHPTAAGEDSLSQSIVQAVLEAIGRS
jgi:hypothetical protein